MYDNPADTCQFNHITPNMHSMCEKLTIRAYDPAVYCVVGQVLRFDNHTQQLNTIAEAEISVMIVPGTKFT